MIGKAILRDGYVYVEHEHVSGVDDVLQRIEDAAVLFGTGAPHRLLVDARYFHRTWRPEQGTIIVDAVKHRFPADTRIAMLLPAELPAQSRSVMGGLRAAGWAVGHFTHEREALAWLMRTD
ncbi:hypothetical protein [Maricaulis sp.]|uniref:hypothetical protein n=1 Tax=Maricaulis sp. TaxID=1486257 RepID=UPI0026351337|nr:hypothetical protein [Maricaulis sp.]